MFLSYLSGTATFDSLIFQLSTQEVERAPPVLMPFARFAQYNPSILFNSLLNSFSKMYAKY